MSTSNFSTMRDFSLYARDFYVNVKRCPVCGTIMDEEAVSCDCCGDDCLEDTCYFDEIDCDDTVQMIEQRLDELLPDLLFHVCSVKSGCYSGIQLYAEAEHDLGCYDYDNEDCHYYFDCCRSVAYRKYRSEIRKINLAFEKVAKEFGMQNLVCTGVFSNGAALYAPATPRTKLIAAACA